MTSFKSNFEDISYTYRNGNDTEIIRLVKQINIFVYLNATKAPIYNLNYSQQNYQHMAVKQS